MNTDPKLNYEEQAILAALKDGQISEEYADKELKESRERFEQRHKGESHG